MGQCRKETIRGPEAAAAGGWGFRLLFCGRCCVPSVSSRCGSLTPGSCRDAHAAAEFAGSLTHVLVEHGGQLLRGVEAAPGGNVFQA